MGIVECKCPSCGALLQAGEDREFWFCGFCGNQFLVQSATVHNTYVNNNNITANVVNVIGDDNDSTDINHIIKKYEAYMKCNDYLEAFLLIDGEIIKYPYSLELRQRQLQAYFSVLYLETIDYEGFRIRDVSGYETAFANYTRLLALCEPGKKESYQTFWLENWKKISDDISSGKLFWQGVYTILSLGDKSEIEYPTSLRPALQVGLQNARILSENGLGYICTSYVKDNNGKDFKGFYPLNAMDDDKNRGIVSNIVFANGRTLVLKRGYSSTIAYKTYNIIRTDLGTVQQYLQSAWALKNNIDQAILNEQATKEYARQCEEATRIINLMNEGRCPYCYSKTLKKTLLGSIVCSSCHRKWNFN